jgi:hypothetical protein
MSRIDIGQNIKKPKTVPATVEGFYQATDAPETIRICAELQDALEAVKRGELKPEEYKDLKNKKKLGCRFYTPHAHFQRGYKRSDGEPVDSGKAIIDLDGCEHFETIYEKYLKGRERELGINMVNKSVSGTGGHVLFDIPEGLTRQEAQAWLAQEMGGVSYDKAVHELERAIYIPCREYILYIDEERMFREASPNPLQREGASGSGTTAAAQKLPLPLERAGGEAGIFPKEYHGIPFTDIVKKYWEVNNRGFEPTQGDRDTLTYQLACDLRHICGKSFEWLDQVIPCYDGFSLEEKRQKIRSALSSKYEGFPTRLRDTLNALAPEAPLSSPPLGGSPEATECTAALGYAACPSKNPPLCTFPKLIKLLTSKTPEEYKAAVAHAVFPSLATHLCGVRFRYTDNVEHEATLMNCLMAGTGSGKGCIDEPINHIMADIRRRDKENLRREAEWKKDCQKKGANKDKLVRPEGLVIQEIDPDMTKPALVTRMDEAEGHFVYVKLNELDLFEQLKGQTGKQHFQLMCLAFDPGAEYGQTRVGTQSVTARPQCRFNWNACTTILKGKRFFQRVLTDGPISRINFCTIPEQEIGADQPVYGLYDMEFDEKLKPYIDNLTAARGLIDCPQATRLARKLQEECAEFARLSQSEVYWNLSHRACVIAWLKACVLYVANGQKWERAIEDFVRWSLKYDLWCKMEFFGAAIEAASTDTERTNKRGPQNLLELLPDEFTIDDACRVRQQVGKDASLRATTHMIRTWRDRGYCAQRTEHSFVKSKKGL